MRIEKLFSKLEHRTSIIFRKIRTAVTEGLGHVDILEKDIHILFKFMTLSPRRSEKYRDDVKSPYRDNDFMFQNLFEASRKPGQSGDPSQFWLNDLLHLLETSHEDLLAEAEQTKETSSADTYRHVTETYSLQIWKSADNHEFFLNDKLVDFEGDTQSVLGAEVEGTRSQLIWMTTDDMIHMVLPISPEVAVIFCDESRCWESPFADSMHRLKVPYPQNSLLKNAPHKDVENVDVPSHRSRRKIYPATTAWRVSIGTLSREHHRIITSYSLLHAETCIVVRSRARFERARRELDVFIKERTEKWKSQGIRFGCHDSRKQDIGDVASPTEEQMKRIVDNHTSALDDIQNRINNTQEGFPMTKEMAFKSWLAVRACEMTWGTPRPSQDSDAKSTYFGAMHPALKIAFEAAYPEKHPDHRDLIEVGFGEFFDRCIGESSFAQISREILKTISDLVTSDAYSAQFAAAENIMTPLKSFSQRYDDGDTETSVQQTEAMLANPAFESMVKAAEIFAILKWMFEERQDILATFVRQASVPMEAMQRPFVRVRAKRV